MSSVRRPPVVADLTWVTAGAMTANVAGYLLQLLAASWLGVEGYSEFASLLAVQLLCAVPALAMQNVVAREVVRGASLRAVRAMMWRCAAMVAAVAVVLIPVVAGVLNVGVWAAAAALGAAPALVILSGEQGILQGGNHFRALATVLAMAGTARVVPALLALALGGGAAGALWAGAAGIVGAAIVAGRIARSTASTEDSSGGDSRESAAVGVVPVLRAVQVQAALMALSSVDLIVVRIVLDEVDASRYSLGTIATKIAFWLPQAVGVVLYPRMAKPTQSARAIRDALSVLSAIGVVAVIGAALAAPLPPVRRCRLRAHSGSAVAVRPARRDPGGTTGCPALRDRRRTHRPGGRHLDRLGHRDNPDVGLRSHHRILDRHSRLRSRRHHHDRRRRGPASRPHHTPSLGTPRSAPLGCGAP